MFFASGMPYNEKDVAMRISTFVFPDQPAPTGLCSKWNDFLRFLIQETNLCLREKNSFAGSPAVNLTGVTKQCIHRRFRESLHWFSRGSSQILVELRNWNPEEQAPLAFILLNTYKWFHRLGGLALERRVFSRAQPPGPVGCRGLWTSVSPLQSYMEVSCPRSFKNLFRSDQSVRLKKSVTIPLILG